VNGTEIRHGTLAGANDKVHAARNFFARRPKRFTDQPFPTIAYDRISDFLGDGESQPCLAKSVLAASQHERVIGGICLSAIDTIEFRLFPHA